MGRYVGWATGGLVMLLALPVACVGSDAAGERSAPSSTRPAAQPTGSGPNASEAVAAFEPVPVPGSQWPVVEPRAAGFDPAALERLSTDAAAAGSLCLTVTRNGKVVLDQSYGSAAAGARNHAYSITKSLTSALVGQAVEADKLETSQLLTEWVPEWVGTDSETATVKDLLQMDAGRTSATDDGDAVSLIASADMTQLAIDGPAGAEPNVRWEYSNAGVQVLERVLRETTGTDVGELAERDLFAPLGMTNSDMLHGQADRTATYFGMTSTCPDLARFGLLYLNGGMWGDRQVVDRQWVLESLQPGNVSDGYGYLWWLSGEVAPDQSDVPTLDAPPDSFSAVGAGGQRILVVPSAGIVATTMTPVGVDRRFSDDLDVAVVKALS